MNNRVIGRSGWVLAAAVGLAGSLTGCSADGGVAGESQAQSTEQALVPTSSTGFRHWALADAGGDGTEPAVAPVDPAICGHLTPFFVITQNAATKRYQTVSWTQRWAQSWSQYTTNNSRAFSSRPACASLIDPVEGADNVKFVMVGKGSDNKLYASLGHEVPVIVETDDGGTITIKPQNPVADTDWSVISNDQYVTGGSPGAAVGRGRMVVVVKHIDSDNKISAYFRPLPYAKNQWSVRQVGPSLPNGWSHVGSPAITFSKGTTNLFTVVTRAKNGNQVAFFRINFRDTGFANTSWTQIPLPAGTVISSDPAIEWNDQHLVNTIYWLSGSGVVQTSLGTGEGVFAIDDGTGPAMTGSPQAIGYAAEDQGSHLIVSRSATGIAYQMESLDSNLTP